MIIEDDDTLCEYDKIGLVVMMSIYVFIAFLLCNIYKMNNRQIWIYDP